MNNNISRSEKLRRLEAFLDSVEISFSRTSDGKSVTAYTTKEPFFCFERPSVDELKTVIADTLASYLLRFFDGTKVSVDIEQTLIAEETRSVPPVERLTRFSRGKPILRRELEPA